MEALTMRNMDHSRGRTKNKIGRTKDEKTQQKQRGQSIMEEDVKFTFINIYVQKINRS